jgi:hypothetical protein
MGQSVFARAVVLLTETVLPIRPILICLVTAPSTCFARLNPKTVLLRLLFLLLSLLLELASGTLVSALLMPGRTICLTPAAELAAVISPTGAMCAEYSSARLILFFAHISAIPSIACWNSALSADRSILAKAYEEMGGSACTALGALKALDV